MNKRHWDGTFDPHGAKRQLQNGDFAGQATQLISKKLFVEFNKRNRKQIDFKLFSLCEPYPVELGIGLVQRNFVVAISKAAAHQQFVIKMY